MTREELDKAIEDAIAVYTAGAADVEKARTLEAMDMLIDIVLNEYPETDDRYKTALAIGIEFGIIEGEL